MTHFSLLVCVCAYKCEKMLAIRSGSTGNTFNSASSYFVQADLNHLIFTSVPPPPPTHSKVYYVIMIILYNSTRYKFTKTKYQYSGVGVVTWLPDFSTAGFDCSVSIGSSLDSSAFISIFAVSMGLASAVSSWK